MSISAKFEGYAAKTVGGVEILRVTGSKKSVIANYAKFRLMVASLMVHTSNLANMLRNNL